MKKKKLQRCELQKINGGVEKFITFYTISLVYYKNNNYISKNQIIIIIIYIIYK